MIKIGKVIYGLHTGEAKKKISCREAKRIELEFDKGIYDEKIGCSQFFNDGISRFWIEKVVNKKGLMYFLHFKLNMVRVVDCGQYCIMPYTKSNIRKLIKNVSKILKKLKLNAWNSDFGEWQWVRFDSAFDVENDNPELFIKLLDKSLNVNAYRKQCSRKYFVPINPTVCESIRFGNDSYIYNVYYKLAELKNKNINITAYIQQEVENIIRIERQNHRIAVKQLLGKGLIKELESNKTRTNIMQVMIKDIEAFWGKGNYYSGHQIMEKINKIENRQELLEAITAFTKNSLESKYELYTADIKKLLQQNKIMPVGITKEDIQKYQISKIDGLYKIINDAFPIQYKRMYREFPVPHECADGRYKVNITLYFKSNDKNKKTITIAKPTLEKCELAVFEKLKSTYVANINSPINSKEITELINKSADSILRFYKVVKSKSVKAKVREYIKVNNLKEVR